MRKDDLYEAVRAGEITVDSPIEVDIFNGPIGGYGFRSGQWPIKINGISFSMFSSIPHSMELTEQKKRLMDTVAYNIQRAIDGETYLDKYSGNVELKYASQMTRQCKCLQCGATWTPRKPEPVQCPRCKRVDWNKQKDEV